MSAPPIRSSTCTEELLLVCPSTAKWEVFTNISSTIPDKVGNYHGRSAQILHKVEVGRIPRRIICVILQIGRDRDDLSFALNAEGQTFPRFAEAARQI